MTLVALLLQFALCAALIARAGFELSRSATQSTQRELKPNFRSFSVFSAVRPREQQPRITASNEQLTIARLSAAAQNRLLKRLWRSR